MSVWQNTKRLISWLWCTLDVSRRVFLNLLFLLLVAAILFAMFGSREKVEDNTVLILDLRGNIVEQESDKVRKLLSLDSSDARNRYIELRDILDTLSFAAKDPQITSVLLLLDELYDASLPALREIGVSLDTLKISNKKIVAWGSHFNQKQYLLAAHADRIFLHPMGGVSLEGFGGYKNYYREVLDKLGVTVNVMRVGEFKSAVEPFIANAPSKASLEADSLLYHDLWRTYLIDVEQARHLKPGSITEVIEQLPQKLALVNGDFAQLALINKWVDGLKTRDELRQFMMQYAAADESIKSFRQIRYEAYLNQQTTVMNPSAPIVGVIVAEGEIIDGHAEPGLIGGLSTAQLIREAREDSQIKALVLRIHSPGGSAFGSELIRREVELTKKAGKPVIVSMGGVAASGGYWMAMDASEIFADATTITGSIGVFTLLPTAEKTMQKIGLHHGGVTTTWLKGAYDPRQAIDPRLVNMMQQSVNRIYADFITKVAQGRHMSKESVEAVAEGRVWSGEQAKERGLIDAIGGVGAAIQAAARHAKLENEYAVDYIEGELTGLNKLLKMFDMSADQAWLEHRLIQWLGLAWLSDKSASEAMFTTFKEDTHWLMRSFEQNQLFSVATHCLCEKIN